MPTNTNLPAAFEITSIDGKRCTKIPRSLTTIAGETSFATTKTEAAAQTTSTTPPPETIISSAQAQGNSPQVAVSVSSTSSAAPTTSIASTPEPETTTSPIPPPAAATTSVAPVETVTPAAASSTSTSETSTSASPASKGTTPTVFSSTPLAILQSELSATPTSSQLSGIFGNGYPSVVSSSSTTSISPSTTSAPAEESAAAAAAAGISSNPKSTAAPVVGGVMGGLAVVGLIGLLLWFLRRRRRKDSLLTPLTTGTKERFYSIDSDSVGPTKRSVRWKGALGYQAEKIRDGATVAIAGVVGIGASLKSKVVGDRSDTPSVNLNRGNSQFLDGQIPQHSRNNSSVLSTHMVNPTVKDRFNEWWESFTERMDFNWRLRQKDRQSIDAFASARSMKERQANMNRPPDFSELLGMDDRELQLQAERRRASLSQSLPHLGSLGIDFSALQDPFADPPNPNNPNTTNKPWAPPNPTSKPSTNPFADPQPPSRSIPKPSTYISSLRRSRGLSMDTTTLQNPFNSTESNPNLPPTTSNKTTANPISRYPSSIAPSRDSYRDTVISSFTTTTRKGKGRSDPFDLERPELWMSKTQNPPMPEPKESTRALFSDPPQTSPPHGQDKADTARRVSATTSKILSGSGTYVSKYSSGVDSDWGDPGPDMGPGSAQIFGPGSEVFPRGSLTEMSPSDEMMGWDRLRKTENVSPVSMESNVSSTGGVGKAR